MNRAALPPLAAAAAALTLLSGWTAVGGAGRARPVQAEQGWILVPAGAAPAAAFFTIRNPGDVPDELVGADWDLPGHVALKEHRHLGATGTWALAPALTVPARGELAMSPEGADILVSEPPPLHVGQSVEFTLRFRRSPELRVRAQAVPPGGLSAVLASTAASTAREPSRATN
ncbi:copper chaperone PCu(A)C [Kitasatospora sp. GP82]|uniref:copper chaperone PCu(A)C n=1 Tax=Kitasatospora sp. GP82 TaxID=3035089 RepID=UPI0024736C53|nr:copper chaperone PCu(A)C [Kitasatospora sp. GP82]MDH6124013.1 copper(I)-binding protein [Kitasatospora sp. GP82]